MEYQLNENGLYLPENYTKFENPDLYFLSERQLKTYREWSELVQWGRRNPVLFAEEIFGVEFMDYQRYAFAMSWNTPYVCWCFSRNGGKSILGSIFIMTKTLLIPNHATYILCGVGAQAKELFGKIEKFVYRQIPSFAELTDIYQSEVQKSQGNTNGFIHDPASHHFKLFNDSEVFSLNGAVDSNRSHRSNLNFYDEAAFVGNDELFTTSEPFTSQDNKFILGKNLSDEEIRSIPLPFDNQLIYASSAGRTDQYFFKRYREFSLRMDAGDKRYFCADINSDMILKATKYGKALVRPLLTQETIDSRMREDKEAGLREYGNIFTSEGGDGQIISRSTIIKNSCSFAPVLFNEEQNRLFGIAYDPARLHDNSVIGIAEFYEDENDGWRMRIVNMVSLVDVMKKKKTPIDTPNQIKILKQLISDYIYDTDISYDSLVSILVDAGSGGAGVPITDFLCEDWIDNNGIKRRGLIDPEKNENDKKKFPNAVSNKLKLLEPAKYKTELYEATIKMMDSGLIEFPHEYLNKGFIELIYEINSRGESKQIRHYPSEKEQEELIKNNITIESHSQHLDRDEELVLKQIDAAKNELVNIYRFKQSSGKDRFDLAPEKANKMHDDRAYVLAMLGWQLAQLRRSHIVNKKKSKQDPMKFFNIRPPKKVTRY